MGNLEYSQTDTELTSEADEEFPFQTEVSLTGLIEAWERAAESDDPVRAALANVIREELRKAPELREPITDPAVIDIGRLSGPSCPWLSPRRRGTTTSPRP
jgi:hypothetical protein